VTVQTRSRRLRTMLVFSTPPDTFYSHSQAVQDDHTLACLFSVLSRIPNSVTACFATLRPNRGTKCNKMRQGRWYCTGHRHPEGTGEYATTWLDKTEVYTRSKSLEGGFLPESPPRVLRDPFLIQCLVTIGRNGLHGEGIAAPLHGRACAGVRAFLQ